MKRLVWFIGAILSLTLCACSIENTPSVQTEDMEELIEPVSISLATVPVKHGYVRKMKYYQAYVVPYSEELTFERSGVFLKYHAKIGDKVKKGDVLAELSDEELREKYNELNQKLEELEKKYEEENLQLAYELEMMEFSLNQRKDEEGNQELKGDIIAAEADYVIMAEKLKQKKELMELEIAQMKRKLNKALDQLNHNLIYAPFDGEIIAIAPLQEDDIVAKDKPIIGIAKTDETRVTCEYISEAEIKSCVSYYMYHDGRELPVAYLPYDEVEYAALVLKGKKPLSRFLYEGDGSKVRQGDSCLLCLVTNARENVLTIPIDALHSDDTGDYVYVDVNGNKMRRDVSVGLKDTISVEITDGLGEGENVYVESKVDR